MPVAAMTALKTGGAVGIDLKFNGFFATLGKDPNLHVNRIYNRSVKEDKLSGTYGNEVHYIYNAGNGSDNMFVMGDTTIYDQLPSEFVSNYQKDQLLGPVRFIKEDGVLGGGTVDINGTTYNLVDVNGVIWLAEDYKGDTVVEPTKILKKVNSVEQWGESKLEDDTSPKLGGDLDGNLKNILGANKVTFGSPTTGGGAIGYDKPNEVHIKDKDGDGGNGTFRSRNLLGSYWKLLAEWGETVHAMIKAFTADVVELRNNDNTAYARLKVAAPTEADDAVTKNYLEEKNIDVEASEVNSSAGTLTLDMETKRQRVFKIDETADFTLAFSNATKAITAHVFAYITNEVDITMPSGMVMQGSGVDFTWDDTNDILTILGGTGSLVELSFTWVTLNSTNYIMCKCSGIYV